MKELSLGTLQPAARPTGTTARWTAERPTLAIGERRFRSSILERRREGDKAPRPYMYWSPPTRIRDPMIRYQWERTMNVHEPENMHTGISLYCVPYSHIHIPCLACALPRHVPRPALHGARTGTDASLGVPQRMTSSMFGSTYLPCLESVVISFALNIGYN